MTIASQAPRVEFAEGRKDSKKNIVPDEHKFMDRDNCELLYTQEVVIKSKQRLGLDSSAAEGIYVLTTRVIAKGKFFRATRSHRPRAREVGRLPESHRRSHL